MSENGRLDEKALRRPGFREDVPVTLCDGQVWYLPRPRLVFVPADTEAGYDTEWEWPDYKPMIDRAAASTSGPEVIGAEFALVRYLLGRNYDLSIDHLRRLVRFDYLPDPDPTLAEMREQILAVAAGRVPAPKAPAASSGSPGSSSA
jgi:hypothetical protein